MEQEQQRKAEEEKVAAANEALRTAYVRVFSGAGHKYDVDLVLDDLGRFCRAHRSTGHSNPHVAARLDGRREVWLRIQNFVNLDMPALQRAFFQEKQQ